MLFECGGWMPLLFRPGLTGRSWYGQQTAFLYAAEVCR